MSELSDALGRGTAVVFGTKTLNIEPLDFNDLLDLEEFTGEDADTLDIGEFISVKRNWLFFLWLVLRKADPELTPEERENGQYRLTEKQAGYLLKRDNHIEQLAMIKAAIGLSGLKEADGKEAEGDADPKPGPAPKPAKKAKEPKPAEEPVPAA